LLLKQFDLFQREEYCPIGGVSQPLTRAALGFL
jgi:hypothetical protein